MTVVFRPVSKEEYEQSKAWGLLTSIDIYGCDPAIIRTAETIERFTHGLCDLLGVRRFGPTQIVRFGADPAVFGYSMVQLIETSLVSAHFAEESNAVYLDVFSCAYYDGAAAVDFSRRFFGGQSVRVQSSLRL